MGDIDLNAARAARANGQGTSIKVVLGSEEFILGSELPSDMFRKLLGDEELSALISGENDDETLLSPGAVLTLIDAVETVFDPEQLVRFRGERPSTPDYVALAAGLLGGSGKSSGSDDSSGTGAKPKRTSKRPTASTSSEPVTEPPKSD